MKANILLLDNDSENLFVVSKSLQQCGYKTFPVTNICNATAILRENHPNIVIVNWDMPDEEIKPLVDLIKQELKDVEFIYTIAMIDPDKPRQVIDAFECGVDDFFHKPIDGSILAAKLRAASRIIVLQKTLSLKCEELVRLHGELRIKNEENQRLAQIDELTGLGNRREGMKRLADSWALCERHNKNMACLYVDIDHFKLINDTYGHEVGDIALKHVANLLRNSARTGEGVFRLGGEEFVIICPVADLDSALSTGERMRQIVEKTNIPLLLNPSDSEYIILKMTVSVGVAVKKENNGPHVFHTRPKMKDPTSPDDLLSVADKQLYLAKESGRNRVC